MRHIHEQVQFLTASCGLFDLGRTAEAKRLATTIRVLVHDTAQAHSLLGQLGVKDTLRYVDTSLEPERPEPMLMPDGRYRVSQRKDSGLALIRIGSGGARFWPALDSRPRRHAATFDSWWSGAVLRDAGGHAFSRKDLVLGLAHWDGGAHVDPELPLAYAALTRSNSLGWEVHRGGDLLSLENPVLANVRQVAHELVQTLDEQLPNELRVE